MTVAKPVPAVTAKPPARLGDKDPKNAEPAALPDAARLDDEVGADGVLTYFAAEAAEALG